MMKNQAKYGDRGWQWVDVAKEGQGNSGAEILISIWEKRNLLLFLTCSLRNAFDFSLLFLLGPR